VVGGLRGRHGGHGIHRGVWIPLYDVVEKYGVRPCLVDAHGMKNVPGRRTDWHECQWIQFLHSVGLLRAAFRPDGDVCAVRSLMRHRSDLVQMSNQHIQHMHKALTPRNVQIHHVISDITGVTGLAIVDAIGAGQRDPLELAKLRDPRIQASEETMLKSLVGNWRPEHLFTLKQSRQMYGHYQEQINAGDAEIQKLLVAFQPRVDPQEKPLPPDRKKKQRVRQKKAAPKTGFDLRTESYKLFGVDLTDSRNHADGAHVIQRGGKGHVAMENSRPIRVVAGIVPGQRHYRRAGSVAGDAEGAQPGGGAISHGGIFSPSRAKPVG
jgi:transposase